MFLSLRISGGSIPLRTGRISVGVDLIQPLIRLIHSLSETSTFLQWVLWLQICEQYLAAEQQRARLVVLRVVKSAPQQLPPSLLRRLHRFVTFDDTFTRCSLKERVRFSMTPRYAGFFSNLSLTTSCNVQFIVSFTI